MTDICLHRTAIKERYVQNIYFSQDRHTKWPLCDQWPYFFNALTQSGFEFSRFNICGPRKENGEATEISGKGNKLL